MKGQIQKIRNLGRISSRQIPMANFLYCFLFWFSIICSAFYCVSNAGAVNFSFPPQMDIYLWKDASISNDLIQLTKSSVNANISWSLGWATYDSIVPFGDGLTFFLAQFDFKPFDADTGNYLGLFRSETDGNPSNQIVALEFDTYKNDYDTDGNHVGIDVNSIQSKIIFSVSGLYEGAALHNGRKWDAWVLYNGSSRVPQLQVLQYPIDLSQYLPPNVMVGLSASTGAAIEFHALHVWNFSSQSS
ncbi:lectin 8-like [Cryptomeria japonica]|uniref:lectin 8-like n=1 Tax=Cryptomeria japonica TaxID=3369 RepID=UPI0027D9DE91|nr:lectin 8-like [Cryptomeria japonica]